MANDLAVPNLAEAIRDQVRQTILKTIPDEQIDSLIKKEWESFFDRPKQGTYYNAKEEPSLFQTMVKAEIEAGLRKKVGEVVQAELQKFSQVMFDSKGKEVLQEMVQGYATAALQGLSQRIAQDCLQQFAQTHPLMRY